MKNKKNTLIYDWIVYVTLVEKESFSAAAMSLNISVGSISKTLSKIENMLGVQLVRRNAHTFEVTEDGKIAYKKSMLICEAYHNLLARLEKNNNAITGAIRLSAPSIVADYIASQWIVEYTEKNANVAIHLLSRESGNFTPESPEFDDLVLKSGYIDSADLIHKSIPPVPFGMYASPNYLKSSARIEDPSDINGHNILRLQHPSITSPLVLLKDGREISVAYTPSQEIVSNNAISLLHLALNDRGICIAAPCWTAEKYIEKGDLVKVLPKWSLPDLKINLVWRYRKRYSALFIDFSKFIEDKWNALFLESR